MKKILFIVSFFFIIACDSEDSGDCFQKAGNIVQQEVIVSSFDNFSESRY